MNRFGCMQSCSDVSDREEVRRGIALVVDLKPLLVVVKKSMYKPWSKVDAVQWSKTMAHNLTQLGANISHQTQSLVSFFSWALPRK